jgi:hypothetical protein
MEARVGIEPTHKGFADLSLTTWVPRRVGTTIRGALRIASLGSPYFGSICWRKGTTAPSGSADWSGRRDLNPRPLPWQGNALPLSYSRSVLNEYIGRPPRGQRTGPPRSTKRVCRWSLQRSELRANSPPHPSPRSQSLHRACEGCDRRWKRPPGCG